MNIGALSFMAEKEFLTISIINATIE